MFTLDDLLTGNLASNPDSVAVVCRERNATYHELDLQVAAVAGWMSNQGVCKGMRVGIHMRKCLEEVVATLACARIGAIFVNISESWTPQQLQYIIEDCQIKTLFTDGPRARKANAAGVLNDLDHVVVVPSGNATIPGTSDWPKEHSTSNVSTCGPIDADLASLLYTSGSTGLPKGVMVTHRNIVDGARSVAKYLRNSSQDRILGLLPMCFDYGLSQLTTCLLVGGTIVLQPVPMAAEIAKTIERENVTGLAAVPPVWIQLVRYLEDTKVRLPSLRYITNSGGKIPDPILKLMPEVLPDVDVYLMYGLTEAFRSTYLSPDKFSTKMGSIGQAVPNVEIFVVDPQQGVCGPGQKGELVHRGSLISKGYWGKPEATDKKIRICEHLRPFLGDEKVLFSGDLVELDNDGDMWFVGRNDELMKCSGYRVSPTEVEEIIFSSGLVDDVVAFGVDDSELGQAICVVLSPRDENTSVKTEEIQHFCRSRMPNYMVPKQIHVWSGKMPRTGSGKVDRTAVRAQFVN